MDDSVSPAAFADMGLDERILKAIADLGWKEPTLIQERAIPLALDGKDIVARARTGSGKTAAFLIPIIQKILLRKSDLDQKACCRALVVVPSKELAKQAYKNLLELTAVCSTQVRCVDLSNQADLAAEKPLLKENPDVVIGTPSKIFAHLQSRSLTPKQKLEFIVFDEADLLFSFGYERDIQNIKPYLPEMCQTFLTSATLSEDIVRLKKLFLHNPVTLKLEESRLPEADQLTQYHIQCDATEKFVLLYAMLKLNLIQGKTIVFVNSVERCYRVKLFLEQFGIKACILNSELPVNSRCHIVQQFNDNVYDILVASDEINLKPAAAKGKNKRKSDKEYGVSRGVDFQNVSNVINFDFPLNVDAYVHRVGRTARGQNQGTALSFVLPMELPLLEEVDRLLSEALDSGGGVPTEAASVFKPYQFRMDQIEGFRYRAEDAMRAVTKVAVREARIKEIRQEMLNSQKLKTYFTDNPRDLQVLRHDKTLHTVRVQPHLKHVPDYLVPPVLRPVVKSRSDTPKTSSTKKVHPSKGAFRNRKRKADPLKSFEFGGLAEMVKKRRHK
ncbi:probable ATP-dependent RNA helicase DDX56 [Paramacrobiotus metropolitanus]|uniref:probable ATP-dependent RNA helicase DDX56 n=1 Tax=Paramacrobiotus metropolitanus TaxID=2943436 RepID=UPI0024464AC9|nr:probable ATP-dependent RNA helicase DDX56 [Paramacrobiotus metropolitanus]XP_055331653.1 probable ATP-dependent RNA helicase DDX56 [Paramacrobiotus metropolitanus]XP_055331654.1 probable ATP-dependent RNA helicase DDX56 [Paramacrobiotus metropolitanus]XP_055331656.1 probable ATP-dependent RNA helicase DDX56 [Paramacrobiotus metropolitanus]XP_055331657.1 probable ATP-dependent RNA helicase DDX56 [Paramacrobiotus metropolitanus]XP_055331658.1 probable ATP-dependent RNA helicase DDX56 [Paramac